MAYSLSQLKQIEHIELDIGNYKSDYIVRHLKLENKKSQPSMKNFICNTWKSHKSWSQIFQHLKKIIAKTMSLCQEIMLDYNER